MIEGVGTAANAQTGQVNPIQAHGDSSPPPAREAVEGKVNPIDNLENPSHEDGEDQGTRRDGLTADYGGSQIVDLIG